MRCRPFLQWSMVSGSPSLPLTREELQMGLRLCPILVVLGFFAWPDDQPASLLYHPLYEYVGDPLALLIAWGFLLLPGVMWICVRVL